MKLNKSLLLGVASVMSLASCSDWLDVNTDPNAPNSAVASYNRLLPHIEFYTNHAYMIGTQPVAYICGQVTQNARTGNQGSYAQWQMTEWRTTTCYQWFYVGAGSNFEQLIKSATEAEAWHYVGVGHLIKAYGMILMNDIHGEMPYADAWTENTRPVYNTGKEMFQLALEDIDAGIENLKKTQNTAAFPLSSGDYWGNGDVSKWIKFGYLLKARMLNKLMKKGNGNASDLKYDPQAILACLENGPQSIDDNMAIFHEDNNDSSNQDVLGWGEPIDYNPLYSIIGVNSNVYFTRYVFDNLTNFAGNGIEDPRADKILPWARSMKSANTPEVAYEQKVKWSEDGKWRRTVGLDMNTTIRTEGAPYSTVWGKKVWKEGETKLSDSPIARFYCDNQKRAGDTIFVQQRSGGTGYYGGSDLCVYLDNLKGSGDSRSAMSGTFFTRATGVTYVGTYAEACFIKAEVLMRQGNSQGAFVAYQNGVRASMQSMNVKLNQWNSAFPELARTCPSYGAMSEADIENYVQNGLGTSGDLTIGKIMTQKHLALGFSIEIWNDMRRYDYDESVFLGWHRPAEYDVNPNSKLTVPEGKQPRRWRVSSHEYRYNHAQLNAIGTKIPEADCSYNNGDWWNKPDMWTIPVWWDSTQD